MPPINSPLRQLSLLDLEAKRRKYPNVPAFGVPATKFSDKTANDLTKSVMRAIELFGGYAVRVQSQGQYDPRTREWRKGTTRQGTADIHAVIDGKHFSIEVKKGKDRLSQAQRKTADLVRGAGGTYLTVRDFDTFWLWLQETKTGK